jgi:hypothetical protein
MLAQRRRRGPQKAVYNSIPGNDVVSAGPRQKPNFMISKHIAKPLIYDPKLNRGPGFVPLKCDQLGSHAGAMLFFAPPPPDFQPLNVPKDVVTTYGSPDGFEEVNVQFTEPLDYQAGIRPSVRRLNDSSVVAPVAPLGFRTPGINERRTFQQTTYDVGKIEQQRMR